MRQNRGRKSRRNLGKWGNIIIFFVMAPIVAILITAGLFKFLISPYIVSDDNEQVIQNEEDNLDQDTTNGDINNNGNSTDTDDTITLKLDGMSMFNVQVGSFSSKENAQVLVDELKQNEINGYMVNKDGYKVFAGTFFSRGEAEKYRDDLKNTYSDAFLKEYYIGGTTIEYLSIDQQYENEIVELIKTIEDSYSQEASLWTIAINSSDISTLRENTISNNKIIDTKLVSIKNKVKSISLQDIITSLESQYNQRKDMVNGLVDSNPDTIKNSYEKFNNALYNYMTTITQGQ